MPKRKLQYFGHLVWTADSLEKSLMLGKIEGRRRREHQKMRWLDGITNAMDMNWVNLGRWWGTGRPGVLQFMGLRSQTQLGDWIATTTKGLRIRRTGQTSVLLFIHSTHAYWVTHMYLELSYWLKCTLPHYSNSSNSHTLPGSSGWPCHPCLSVLRPLGRGIGTGRETPNPTLCSQGKSHIWDHHLQGELAT